MKLWPSRSSIVVEARRTISAGTETPFATVTVCVVSICAHFRLDLQVDQAAAEHGRRKGKTDAVFLVVDRDLSERAGHRDRIFAAGQEARGIAGERDQIGLGQAAGDALLLERIDRHVDRGAAAEIMRAIAKPNGEAPEITPAATSPADI